MNRIILLAWAAFFCAFNASAQENDCTILGVQELTSLYDELSQSIETITESLGLLAEQPVAEQPVIFDYHLCQGVPSAVRQCVIVRLAQGWNLHPSSGGFDYGGRIFQVMVKYSDGSNPFNLSNQNLSGQNLSGANLSGANLYGAILTGANLTDANLYGAILTGANLHGANLHGVNLSGAVLTNANLNGANLTNADLSYADLTGADLTGADLTDADLTGASMLCGVNCGGVLALPVGYSCVPQTMAVCPPVGAMGIVED